MSPCQWDASYVRNPEDISVRFLLAKLRADMQHTGAEATIWQVILGRVVSGIGGVRMNALVSIFIAGI
jgi:hypothetical protein